MLNDIQQTNARIGADSQMVPLDRDNAITVRFDTGKTIAKNQPMC